MRPKIVTSFRPHGKWGDFLAAVIPGIWCLNILTNSNFILRLVEWQNESSLFLIRIRARQWYWVYKFELKNFTEILTTPKNLGRNKWQLNTFGDLKATNDYLHVLQLRAQNKWTVTYWNSILNRHGKIKQPHASTIEEHSNFIISNKINKFLNNNLSANLRSNLNYNNLNYFFKLSRLPQIIDTDRLNETKLFNFNTPFLNFWKNQQELCATFFSKIIINNIQNNFNFSDFIESSRYIKKQNGTQLPFRLIKLNSNWTLDTTPKLFNKRFGTGNSVLQSKNVPDTSYMVIKQKRYERKKTISPIIKYVKNPNSTNSKIVRYSGKTILLNNSIFEDYIQDASSYYRMLKKNKKRSETISVNLSRRILRTKRTLVLPAHTNITLITNSFDIVHSWFIPGLGIKLDCVPGRSTHHTFYVDSVGFYYGQCAEICGRYHHHMPIRLCALPFEHFLIWWHTFGLPKLLYTTSQRKFETYYGFRKYIW